MDWILLSVGDDFLNSKCDLILGIQPGLQMNKAVSETSYISYIVVRLLL
jgi:hypothetical protein